MPDFTTGSTVLPDVGQLSYNGVIFSSLFSSSIKGTVIKDEAQRTTKYMQWVLNVEGVVTLGPDDVTIDNRMVTLWQKLNQHAGQLTYTGRGFGNININPQGALVAGGRAGFIVGQQDVAWGPVPETFNFTPLGTGLSALVSWSVTFRLTPYGATKVARQGILKKVPFFGPILQFNEEITVTIAEDGYSQLSIHGTLELPATRNTVNDRSTDAAVLQMVDYQKAIMDAVSDTIDLTRYLVPRRSFSYSRDRRTLQWEFTADEQPPMGLPPWATQARGHFSVRPHKTGRSIVRWVCSMRCSYVIRKDFDRNNAYRAFVSLLNARYLSYPKGHLPDIKESKEDEGENERNAIRKNLWPVLRGIASGIDSFEKIFGIQQKVIVTTTKKNPPTAWIYYFGLDEGLYLDSKTVTFEVNWMLLTTFSTLLKACGFLQDSGIEGGNLWRTSMANITGHGSWLANQLKTGEDVIVDFGM
jgi:hypothetical protein